MCLNIIILSYCIQNGLNMNIKFLCATIVFFFLRYSAFALDNAESVKINWAIYLKENNQKIFNNNLDSINFIDERKMQIYFEKISECYVYVIFKFSKDDYHIAFYEKEFLGDCYQFNKVTLPYENKWYEVSDINEDSKLYFFASKTRLAKLDEYIEKVLHEKKLENLKKDEKHMFNEIDRIVKLNSEFIKDKEKIISITGSSKSGADLRFYVDIYDIYTKTLKFKY